MKKYETPEMEITLFDASVWCNGVITASDEGGDDDGEIDW